VKRQIAKSLIIGVGITAIGGVLFFVDAWNDIGQRSSTFSEALLTFLWSIIWWPLLFAGSSLLNSSIVVSSIVVAGLLIVAAVFWGTLAYGFIEANKKARATEQVLKR